MTIFAFDIGQDWGAFERYAMAMVVLVPATFIAVVCGLGYTAQRAVCWLASRSPRRAFGRLAADGILLAASSSLFVAATLLPAWMREVPGVRGASGADCLLAPLSQRWLFLAAPWWWANVLLGCGLVCLVIGQQKAAALCGLTASVLALSYWVVLDSWQPPRDESGYWTWLASMGILTVPLAWCCWHRVRSRDARDVASNHPLQQTRHVCF
jgi:hypothetical protein